MSKYISVTGKFFTTFIAGIVAAIGATFSNSALAGDSCSKCNELTKNIKTWENSLMVYKKNLDDNNKLLEKIRSNEKLKTKRNSAEEGQIRLNIINATALIETANNTLEKNQRDMKELKCNECTENKHSTPPTQPTNSPSPQTSKIKKQ